MLPVQRTLRRWHKHRGEMAVWEAVSVEGTWGSKRGSLAWWRWGSDFWHQLIARGFAQFDVEEDAKFHWDDGIEGVFGKNKRWILGGMRLKYFMDAYRNPDKKALVVAHSHGGQVAAYAAANGTKMDVLVTMATPVRKDMIEVYKDAQQEVGLWIHIHSNRSDWMQWLGSWFDGSWKLRRRMKYADIQISLPGVGHSGMLDPAVWEQYGIYDAILRKGNDNESA